MGNRRDELRSMVQRKADDQMDDIFDYGLWDGDLENGDLTDGEFEDLRKQFKVSAVVEDL